MTLQVDPSPWSHPVTRFFRTAVHFKNVPLAERLARVLFGALLAASPALLPAIPLWVSLSSGLGLALTGFVGLCPACSLVGRRLEARSHKG